MVAELTGKALFGWRRAFLVRFCALVLPGPRDGFPDPHALGTVAALQRYVAGLHVIHRLGLYAGCDALAVLSLVLGGGKPFTRLTDAAAERYLARLESSRVYAIRSGFVAIKALVMLIYFGHPAVEAHVGYRASCSP